MSFKAMAWATEQEITTTSPQSHLLLILASFANDNNECYPSISTIERKTRLSHNTIRKCLKELIDFGLISDTKKTSQFNTKVYQLNLDLVGVDAPNLNDTHTKFGSPTNFEPPTKNGMTPLPNLNDTPTKFGAEPLPNLVANPVINPININHKETCYSETHAHESQDFQTQKDFENQQTTLDKPKSSDKKYLTADDLIKLGVDNQVAIDYLATRKTKLTQTALNGIIKQSALANITLNQALEFTCEMGWQSFKADWYLNSQKSFNQPQNNFSQPISQHEQLKQMAQNWDMNHNQNGGNSWN